MGILVREVVGGWGTCLALSRREEEDIFEREWSVIFECDRVKENCKKKARKLGGGRYVPLYRPELGDLPLLAC
jgi:hypothetical protein